MTLINVRAKLADCKTLELTHFTKQFLKYFVTVWKCLVDLYVKIKRRPKLLTFQIVCEME